MGMGDMTTPPGRLLVAAGLICALILPVPAVAQSLTADQVARAVTAEFDVDVLRVRPMDGPGGEPAYAVTVMLPGGSRNNAFQLTTVLVEGNTGALSPQFRHGPTGHQLPGAPSFVPPTIQDGPALRRSLNRPSSG